MSHQAFLMVCYMLGMQYHSGQWSKGYRLMCLAEMRVRQEHSAWNLGRTLEQIRKGTLYPKGCSFRNEIAYVLRKMKHHRFSL